MSKRKTIILALLVFVIIVLFFLPTIVKNHVINNSKELIGRQVSIGDLKYNYFSSTAKVLDFKMFEENGSTEFVTFDTLVINVEPYRLLFNEKVVEQFYIKGLMVNVVLQDSTFNFDDLIAFHSEENDSITEVETEVFKYDISNIELKEANFFFDNKNVNHVTSVDDFEIFIPNIGWNQEEKSNADIKFNFKNGGYLESSLNINPVDGHYDANITIKELLLNPFYEYVLEYAEINSFKGFLNSQIKIEGNINEPVNAIVSGKVDVHDFSMTDTNDKEVLKSKRVDASLRRIDYANSSYELDSLNFFQPYIYFELDSVTNNMFKLFKLDSNGDFTGNEVDASQQFDTTSSELYYAINNLKVDNGIMDYSDNLTGQRFNYHLNDIKIDSDGINSRADWVNIYSNMLLNNRGTLNAKIGYNPLDLNNINFDFTIENFLLSDVNIYSRYYMGHSTVVGDFYYYSQSQITNGDIVSENHLLVKNVEVRNERNGLFNLPLKFALFLLKDRNGDVNLEIPVRGNLNDPKINIGKIVWTTFKRKITGAAASPINSLASLVDVNPKDYEELVFKYTDTIPTETQFQKLNKLLEIEEKKEGLKIELVHFVDPKLQREAVVLSELGNQYFNDTKKDYLKDEKGFESYLRARVSNDSINVTDAAFQIIEPRTADSLALIYNETLIKNTRNYLKETKEATNISVIKSDLEEPENTGSISKFKIKFDLLDKQNSKKDSTVTKNI
jgi:hypothetical protein